MGKYEQRFNCLSEYDESVAAVYDLLMGGDLLAKATAESCEKYVRNKRTLDVGVGSASVARWLCKYASFVMGVDNSVAMINAARMQKMPDNLMLLVADFRNPLPVVEKFGAAVSTRGSLACVGSKAELGKVMKNIHGHLESNSYFVADFYSYPVYESFIKVIEVSFDIGYNDLTGVISGRISDDILSMETLISDAKGKQIVNFCENVLLLQDYELFSLFIESGYSLKEKIDLGQEAPFDRFVLSLS